MNYAQISRELSALRGEYSKLTKQLILVRKTMSELELKKSNLEEELFLEYVQLNTPITMKSFGGFSAYQIGKLPDGKSIISSSQYNGFGKDDMIQVIKKNRKTVIVECIKKKKRDPGQNTDIFVNPQSKFRVKTQEFKSFLFRDETFSKNFLIWIKRKQSLDSILE